MRASFRLNVSWALPRGDDLVNRCTVIVVSADNAADDARDRPRSAAGARMIARRPAIVRAAVADADAEIDGQPERPRRMTERTRLLE